MYEERGTGIGSLAGRPVLAKLLREINAGEVATTARIQTCLDSSPGLSVKFDR